MGENMREGARDKPVHPPAVTRRPAGRGPPRRGRLMNKEARLRREGTNKRPRQLNDPAGELERVLRDVGLGWRAGSQPWHAKPGTQLGLP